MSNSGRGRGFPIGGEEPNARSTTWLLFVNNSHKGVGLAAPPSQITWRLGESYDIHVKYLNTLTSIRGNDLRHMMGYGEFICIRVSIRFHVPCWYYARRRRKCP